jgi:hypothetical protein
MSINLSVKNWHLNTIPLQDQTTRLQHICLDVGLGFGQLLQHYSVSAMQL